MSRTAKPPSAGVDVNRSIAASASATSLSAPRSSSVSTSTPVAVVPHSGSPRWRNRSSVAARISGRASSRSPRRAFSRARYTLMSGKSPRLYPRRTSASPTSARSFCPRVALRSGSPVHQRDGQRPPVDGHREVITGSFGNPEGILDLAHHGIVGPQHAIRYPQEVAEADDRGVYRGSTLRAMARPSRWSSRHPARPRQ